MPEGAINGDILIYVPRKIEPEVYITIPCEYNLRKARMREKEKWRREAGRKKSRRWFWPQLCNKECWLLSLTWCFHIELMRLLHLGTEEGRTMELLAPISQRLLQETWTPPYFWIMPPAFPGSCKQSQIPQQQWHYPCMSWASKWKGANSTPQLSTSSLLL